MACGGNTRSQKARMFEPIRVAFAFVQTDGNPEVA
jgi:hypothetical protein